MDKIEFAKEKQYLDETINLLKEKIFEGEELSNNFSYKLQESNKEYLSDMRDMNLNNMNDDTMLELSQRQNNLEYMHEYLDKTNKENKIYSSMLNSPYFAKISILPEDSKFNEDYYIGVHSLMKDNSFKIIDWRSPISEVFYNFEVGDAYIKTDTNVFNCKLLNKRQFKIENSELQYYFDSSITINDEILKDALGQNKSGGLKSIVQTIQKEQNEIIRKDEYKTMLVNGVAGSGKTAIALHRVAYLLYKLKGKLSSNEVMFLSPNEAFSNYISTVLPELSEDDMLKTQFDFIIKKGLNKQVPIEKKFEQNERMVVKQAYVKDYSYKYSIEFCEKLIKFCKNVENSFIAKDVLINDIKIEQNDINTLFYDTYGSLDVFTKICYLTDKIVNDNYYFIKNKLRLKMIKQQIFSALYSMFKEKNVFKLYSQFLESLNMKFSLLNGKIKNEDASAIFLIKATLFGFPNYSHVKHLLVDEVQDYSAVQLYIISKIFKCPKTLLGDIQQSIISNYVSNNFNCIDKIIGDDVLHLNLTKSYRPTRQIADLYNFVNKSNSKDVVLREGEKPEFVLFDNDVVKQIKQHVENLKSKYKSIAIITKTNRQAINLFNQINDSEIQLISNSFETIKSDIVILSAFNCKGMEFDAVICFDVSNDNFKTECDNKLLFIMISRALHKVEIMYSKMPEILLNYKNN